MLWVPQKGRLRYESNLGTVGDATPGTQVTTGASASTKGSATTCFGGTAFDAYLIGIYASRYAASATNANLMVDIMVGDATEELLIPNLMFGNASSPAIGPGGRMYLFPLYIPAGTRITAAAAGQRVSQAFSLGVMLWGGDAVPPFRVGRKVTTYGVTTVPAGTTITPGASGAAGSFTEIVSSTSEDHFAVMAGFQVGDDTTKGERSYAAAIGVGAATEEELSTVWHFDMTSAESAAGPQPPFPAFADIPSGTRLAMRFSNSGTNDSGNYNGCIYAVS